MTDNEHTHAIIIEDPTNVFYPGEIYPLDELVEWLQEGTLPVGLRLRNGREWTVIQGLRGLEVTDGAESFSAKTLKPQLPPKPRATEIIQNRILRFYYERETWEGESPMQQEVAALIGCTEGSVRYHMGALEKRGLVVRSNPGNRRGIELTQAGYELARTL